MVRRVAEKSRCAATSTGRCLTLVLAGSSPRKLSPFQFVNGLMGRGANPPPQLGQTSSSTSSTHCAQNVHSYEQMRALVALGGNVVLQFSQVGLSSSIVVSPLISSQEYHSTFSTRSTQIRTILVWRIVGDRFDPAHLRSIAPVTGIYASRLFRPELLGRFPRHGLPFRNELLVEHEPVRGKREHPNALALLDPIGLDRRSASSRHEG